VSELATRTRNGALTVVDDEDSMLGMMLQQQQASVGTAIQMAAAMLDKRISTARAYPRSITKFKREAAQLLSEDVETARAVLLALAGQECGRVQFDLRPGATWETILMMRARGLGWVVDALLGADGVSSRTADPEIVRAWAAHGQAVLTISVPS